MRTRLCIIVLSVVLFTGITTASAGNKTYDFNDPKGVNAVSIIVDSMLEPNVGYADKVKGSVIIDHAGKKIVKGEITIPTGSVTMSNSMMTKVLHSKDWLNKKKNPEISFVFNKVISITDMGDTEFKVTVQGALTVKGITKTVSAPISLSFYPGKLSMRNKGANGDIALLRSEFEISRADFQIKPGMSTDIVGDIGQLHMNQLLPLNNSAIKKLFVINDCF